MEPSYSLEQLALAVQDWCKTHRIRPANGQASDQISERSIRYYRTLGLLDAPEGGYIKHFTEKHRLQLLAIRLYQSLGLPLRRIQAELYGKGLDDLRSLIAGAENRNVPSVSAPPATALEEQWRVMTLSDDFLLVSRQGRSLTPDVLERLRDVLHHYHHNRGPVDPAQN